MCFTVEGVWHIKHCGRCSCFNMKEWPMRNWDIMTCFLLDFLKADLDSLEVGLIWKSIFCVLLSQHCCHFARRNLLILGLKSVYGILNLSVVRSKADWAAESALSFPKTVLFPTIQISTSSQFRSIWSVDRTLSGATTPGPSSDGNEGVLHIPQSFNITVTSPSDCLASYAGHSLGGVLPLRWDVVGLFYSPSQLGPN